MAVSVAWMALAVTCLKLLLVPTYHSTDFEVHRNWLAITHSLPISQWYLDETSPWTLDYPPFFAWFQKLLAVPAPSIDPLIVDVKKGLNHDSPTAVLYMRATVMFSDALLFFAVHHYTKKLPPGKRLLTAGAVIFSPGLLIVDHIHFQYNGILLGLLILSISCIQNGQNILGAVLFAALVCSKHLFIVAGPAYFVFLLRSYCRGPHKTTRFLTLAASVLTVLALAFGPFVYYKQIPQVMSRLFPFGRGLTHAYWAPNAWALYNVADKVFTLGVGQLGWWVPQKTGALTGGLVGEAGGHAVLPEVNPLCTALLVLLALLPCLARLWRNPKPSEFVRAIAYSHLAGFMFGWHVHEKAILTAVVPLALIALESRAEAGRYLFLSTVAHYSLFPLLYQPREYPLKLLLCALYSLAMWACLRDHFGDPSDVSTRSRDPSDVSTSSPELERAETTGDKNLPRRIGRDSLIDSKTFRKENRGDGQRLLSGLEWGYLSGLVVVEGYASWFHRAVFGEKLPFLPLMLVSTYCAVGIAYAWILQLKMIALPHRQSKERAD